MTAYSASDICSITDVTYRQLDYWIRSGKLGPQHRDHGHGNPRRFTSDDVIKIGYASALLGDGFTVDAAVALAVALFHSHGEPVAYGSSVLVQAPRSSLAEAAVRRRREAA